jgi:hypothetical protein
VHVVSDEPMDSLYTGAAPQIERRTASVTKLF